MIAFKFALTKNFIRFILVIELLKFPSHSFPEYSSIARKYIYITLNISSHMGAFGMEYNMVACDALHGASM